MTNALETSRAQKLALDIPVGSLIKTTLVDFPGRVSASFFLRGCNLRCPYCYNAELVLTGSEGNGSDTLFAQSQSMLSTINELFAHLEKRRNVLSGLVISGGEPLLNEYTPVIIQKAKSLGYKIKLDTNGTLPDKLQKFLCDENLRPDFVAMDIKTSPHRYAQMLLGQKAKQCTENTNSLAEKITLTANLIAALPSECREWRTVLVPTLVDENDIRAIAAILPKDASWQCAQFRNENCLDVRYNNIAPYTDEEAARLVSVAKSLIHGAEMR